MSMTVPSVLPPRNRSIRDFEGDFQGLAQLVNDAFAQNSSQSLVYTEEFLRSHFDYPGTERGFAPTIYKDGKMVGFIAGFPRQVVYRGIKRNLLAVSFLSIAAEFQKSGFGIILWNELVRRARHAGYDGVMNFCIDGDSMNKMMPTCLQRVGVAAPPAYQIRYMTKLLMPQKSQATQESVDDSWMERFIQTATASVRDCQLARVWTMEEVRWQCQSRAGTVVASLDVEGRSGFLTGNLMPIPKRNDFKCLLIEDVLIECLLPEERRTLINRFLSQAVGSGAKMAILPILGYFDVSPFCECRFIKSPRLLHAYFALFAEEAEPVDSLYIDVF